MDHQWVEAQYIKKDDVLLIGRGHRATVIATPYPDPEAGHLLRIPYRFQDRTYQGEDHDHYRARPTHSMNTVTEN